MESSNNNSISKNPKFVQEMIGQMTKIVRQCNTMPSQEDIFFYSQFPGIKEKLKLVNEKIAQILIKTTTFSGSSQPVSAGNLNRFKHITDSTDIFLLEVDLTLDKIQQQNLLAQQSAAQEQKSFYSKYADPNSNINKINGSAGTEAMSSKPQNNFLKSIDNSKNPFIPKIQVQHNKSIELDDTTKQAIEQGNEFFQIFSKITPQTELPHPYAYELNNLNFNEWQLESDIVSKQPAETKGVELLTFIDSKQKLEGLVADIKQNYREIAIDVEHHAHHSYLGLTCLIQLSTRGGDYIIDPFPIWDDMQILNEITSDPNIVKVLHGADHDVEWLQRDFGVYIVNMFDTYHASKLLQYSSLSLAFLLQKFCNYTANKSLQLADWRQRPLTKELIDYARNDTHNLLFIYDQLRKQLIIKSAKSNPDPLSYVKSVLTQSKEVCMNRYSQTNWLEVHFDTLKKSNKIYLLSDDQKQLLFKILLWRDDVARELDESPNSVASFEVVFNLVDRNPPNNIKDLINIHGRNLHESVRHRPEQLFAIISGQTELTGEQREIFDKQFASSNQNDNVLNELNQTSSGNQTYNDRSDRINIKSQKLEIYEDEQANREAVLRLRERLSKVKISFGRPKHDESMNDESSLSYNNTQIFMPKSSIPATKKKIPKENFNFANTFELFRKIYPAQTQFYRDLIQKDRSNIDLLESENQNSTNNKQETKEREIERIDFIQLPQTKEVPQAPQDKVVRLNMNELQTPLSEAHDISLNRQRNKLSAQNDKGTLPVTSVAADDGNQNNVIQKLQDTSGNPFTILKQMDEQNGIKDQSSQDEKVEDDDFDSSSDEGDDEFVELGNAKLQKLVQIDELDDEQVYLEKQSKMIKQRLEGNNTNSLFQKLRDPIDSLYKNKKKGKFNSQNKQTSNYRVSIFK